jgi:Fe-S-cluster-containing dehydrogenase component/DMSO reductase anchor subunit
LLKGDALTETRKNKDSPVTLIDELLAEQRSLTAVSKFARAHELHELPAQATFYRDLIPFSRPRAGQQYAFEVHLDKCSGCKACVTACHSLNGLDDEETWRNVGLLHGGTYLHPVQTTVTTACHHCIDPGCLNGCPVLAYEKDSATGIVKHLDDQCIGCQYCVLKCPYDVPKYSERLGIVRKCDMCSSRLGSGEAPACVQACPNEAIRITVVEQSEVVDRFTTTPQMDQFSILNSQCSIPNPFLPGSPDPAITIPTTRYKSSKPLHESLCPADAHELKPEPAHTPLVIMLVLSQLSVGAFAAERILSLTSGQLLSPCRSALTVTALVVGLVALASSLWHLGRPLGAWRAFLGLRKSWLSREIVVFGLFATLATLYTASVCIPELFPRPMQSWLGWATVATGLPGVFCSAMIYHDTRRDFWHLRFSGGKFLGTTTLLGASISLLVIVFAGAVTAKLVPLLSLVVALAGATKLAVELPIFRRLETEDWSPLYKTALLLDGPFALFHRCRVVCGIIGGILLPAFLALQTLTTDVSTWVVTAEAASIAALSVAGEFMERRLFFVAVQPVKMPGGVPA